MSAQRHPAASVRRDDVVFVATTGTRSLDYYSQKLAAELPVRISSTDIYARTALRFNTRLVSRASLASLRDDAAFVRALRRERALLHLPNHHMGRYGAFLTRPYLITVHDLIRILDAERDDALIHRPNRRDRVHLRFDAGGIRRARHVIAVSHATRRDLVGRLGIDSDRVTVVYEGVDRSRFRPVSARPAPYAYPYIVYVGSEHPRKDMPTLMRTLARIRSDARFHDLRLVKIGPPGGSEARFRAATLAAIRECGLEEAVYFAGQIPEVELAPWYSGAALLLLPSRSEGFGLPPLEAMACGCPVVVSDAGSLPEVAGGAALVAPAGDDRAFAARSLDVLTDAALGDRLVRLGLARAAQLSWQRAARETLAVYDRVLGEPAEPRRPKRRRGTPLSAAKQHSLRGVER